VTVQKGQLAKLLSNPANLGPFCLPLVYVLNLSKIVYIIRILFKEKETKVKKMNDKKCLEKEFDCNCVR